MARRSSRITEMMEKTELSCMPGLFSILETKQSRPKMILNGDQLKKHAFDSPGKLEQATTSFDAECQKIQNEASLDANDRSVGSLIQEEMSIEKHKNKQIVVKGGKKHNKTASGNINHTAKTRKQARNNSQKALSNASHHPPSTPSEMSLNKRTISAILGAVSCDPNQCDENKISEGFRRNIHLGRYDHVDEMNMRHVQMSAKAFIDQIFIDRMFKEGTSSEHKPFSNALEVLNSNKDLFVDLLREPDSLIAKWLKNMRNSLGKKETIRSVLDGSDCELSEETIRSVLDGSDCELSVSALTTLRRKTSNESHISLTSDPSHKIVILKPALENTKCSENVTCHCSSLQSHKRLDERSRSIKPSYFSLEEIKRKLKLTFGSNRNEPNRLLAVSDENRPSPRRGADENKNSLHALNNGKKKENSGKKEDFNSNTSLDIARGNDMVRQKLDFSSIKYPKKQEFDVILEAKKHLSARLKNLNAFESSTSKRTPKTLGRILSSPEHDFWPLSPRRDSLHAFGSTQMRFSPYNMFTTSTEDEKRKTCLSPLRQNKEIMIVGIDEQGKDNFIDENERSNGQMKILEKNEIRVPESSIIRKSADTSEIHEEDGSTMQSMVDSLSENETSACATDDFPSTPSSVYRLDMVDNVKYHEEHQSPISVLEPFFSEESNSPPSITLQKDAKKMQPRCFDFEDCSFEPFLQDPPNSHTDEQDYISHYVHLVMKASCLNWDELLQIRPPQETLLDASLFDQVEFQPTDIYFDPKLLFDHMNEILLEMYKCQSSSSPSLLKRRPLPLEKRVLDEIMKGADFYLLPQTEKRTLDQLVSKDVKGCRTWLDVRIDTEEIVVNVAEDLVEETIMDMLLEFHS